MYSRKKIPAPFGKTQKTAEKKKEATTVLPQKEASKEPIFPVLALLLLELLSAKKDASPACVDNRML